MIKDEQMEKAVELADNNYGLASSLRKAKVGMFSERDNTTEAFEYAQELLKHSTTPASITTALMVYHNSLVESLAKTLES